MSCDASQEDSKRLDRKDLGRRHVDVGPVVFRRKTVLGAQEMCAESAQRWRQIKSEHGVKEEGFRYNHLGFPGLNKRCGRSTSNSQRELKA